MARFVIDDFSGGINASATKRNMKNDETYVGITPTATIGTVNTAPSKSGGLERRHGFRDRQSGLLAAVGNVPITGMGIYRPANSSGSKRILVAANQRVHSLSYSGSVLTYANDLTSGYTTPNINPTNNPVIFKQWKDWIFAAVHPDKATGAVNAVYRWDGKVTDPAFGGAVGWTNASLAIPYGAITATSAAAGGRMVFSGTGATGEYRYKFTFIHGHLGESHISIDTYSSALGAATTTGRVAISAMPWISATWRNTDDRRSITAWRLYRTLHSPNLNDDSLNTYYLVTQSTDFSTATYNDDKDDSELVKAYQGSPAISIQGSYFMEVHKGRMWYGGQYYTVPGDSFYYYPSNVYKPSTLMWSFMDQPCRVEGETTISQQDGYRITGLKSFLGDLVVFMENSIHAIYGDSPQNFSKRALLPDLGCVAPFSIAEGDGALFWLSQQGVVKYYGDSRYEIISRNLSPFFERSSPSGKQAASAGFKDGKYYLSLNRHESTIWVYDNSYAAPKSWYRWTTSVPADKPNPYCWLKLDDVLEAGELYFGTDSTGGGGGGRVVQIGGRFTDSGYPQDADVPIFGGASSPVEMSVQTKQYDMGTPDTIKQFKSVCVDAEEMGNGMVLTWVVDNGSASGTIALSSGKSGAGTEGDPYSTSPNTRPIVYTLPQRAFGRFISFQVDAEPSGVSSPHKIDRIIVEYEETGTAWLKGD